MIRIHHVLKDGTKVNDITGHVIGAKDFETLYQIIGRIQERENKCQQES